MNLKFIRGTVLYIIELFFLFILATGVLGTQEKGYTIRSYLGVIGVYSLMYIVFFKENIEKCVFYKLVFLFCILWIIEVAVPYFSVQQPVIDGLSTSIQFFIIATYFMIMKFPKSEINLQWLGRIVTLFSSAILFLSIVQFWLIEKGKGVKILYIDENSTRYGTVRIKTCIIFIAIGVIIQVCSLMFSKKITVKNMLYSFLSRLLSIIYIIASIYYFIFVAKTRSVMMMLVASCIVAYMIRKKIKIHRIIINLAVIGILAYIVLSIPYFQNYFETSLGDDLGVIERQKAIKYFLNLFFKNIVTGVGIINPSNTSLLSYIRGNEGTYYFDDVGFIGFITQFGLLGMTIYVIMLLRMAKCCYEMLKVERSSRVITSITMFVYAVLSNINLSLLDQPRIFALVIILSYVEITYSLVMKKINEKEGEMVNEEGYLCRSSSKLQWSKSGDREKYRYVE